VCVDEAVFDAQVDIGKDLYFGAAVKMNASHPQYHYLVKEIDLQTHDNVG
jgi:hypothetical protein